MNINAYLAKHYAGKAPAARRAPRSGQMHHDNGGNATTQASLHDRTA